MTERIRSERETGTGLGRRTLRDVQILVVALAEGYKETDSIESSVEFYEDVDDHIDIYGPDIVDHIVTETRGFETTQVSSASG